MNVILFTMVTWKGTSLFGILIGGVMMWNHGTNLELPFQRATPALSLSL